MENWDIWLSYPQEDPSIYKLWLIEIKSCLFAWSIRKKRAKILYVTNNIHDDNPFRQLGRKCLRTSSLSSKCIKFSRNSYHWILQYILRACRFSSSKCLVYLIVLILFEKRTINKQIAGQQPATSCPSIKLFGRFNYRKIQKFSFLCNLLFLLQNLHHRTFSWHSSFVIERCWFFLLLEGYWTIII